ncbi:hypothetical protein ACFVS2_25090 [Brevibacillus sp. NPDC058079]|uniref:hypothetical protein n=1 Tax=Brevibacillus sp. NPDC058079 TaxID=3346330 RepID=UPI0036E0F999
MSSDLINIENYKNEDGFEVTRYYKDLYIKQLEMTNVEEVRRNADMKDTVTLFHGTTTAHLNSILQHGLLPRKETEIDNWKGIYSSANTVIYLTNKWHYFYAYQATSSWMEEKAKERGEEIKDFWVTWETFPCYIECEVPKALLVTDEDFFHSTYVSQKIKSAIKKERDFTVTWDESLAHYATAGVLGGVPVEFIKSFSILGELELYKDLMLVNGQYQRDLSKWGHGKGKGDLKLIDIQKREDQSLSNGTWFMGRDVFPGDIIGKIGMNPKSNTIAISIKRGSKFE